MQCIELRKADIAENHSSMLTWLFKSPGNTLLKIPVVRKSILKKESLFVDELDLPTDYSGWAKWLPSQEPTAKPPQHFWLDTFSKRRVYDVD